VATTAGRTASATSTDTSGTYRLRVSAGDYIVSAELAAFARFERVVSLASDSCARTIDVELVLGSRAFAGVASRPGATDVAGGPPESSTSIQAPSTLRRPPRLGAASGDRPSPQRFAQLQLLESGAASAVTDAPDRDADPAARLLPPGFSTDAATSVVALTGDAARLDRGQLRDRLAALGRGEFEAAGGLPPEAFAARFGTPGGGAEFPGTPAEFLGGRGGPPPGGFQGGPTGRGGPFLGRGRGGNVIQGSANYNFGGSALDAAPYPIRGSQSNLDYRRQNFGGTVGGPLRIPGAYDGSRTTFFVNYSGGRSSNVVDQYATVPTEAVRAGDFSSLAVAPIDPLTGQPFPDGRIPGDRMDPSALSLLTFIPTPNLPGSAQNYRRNTTVDTVSDGLSVRVTHNFSGTLGRRGGGPGGRGRGVGRGGGPGGGRSGTAVVLNAQVQYRNDDGDSINVYPLLGGLNTTSSLSVPVSLNVLRGRVIHNLQVNTTRSTSASRNAFAGIFDVAGAAGINGVASHPSEWGVPTLSFSSLTGARGLAPDSRNDRRIQVGYTLTRPFQRHALRLGGDVRFDTTTGRNNSDARGTFVFTGLYTTPAGVQSQGLDFADFLLGLPQQATAQYVGDVTLRGQSFSLFAQDDWRLRGDLTLNFGVRYEVVRPYTEASGRMVNLDVASDFTGASPVVSGGSGPYTGAFPEALVNGDYDNVGPRVGVAWRMTPRTVVRGGYGVSFNNGSYVSIARQLSAQPPFAVTSTSIGSIGDPLRLSDPFAQVDESTTTNNFGADKNYQLGVIHIWNLDINRNAGRGWQFGAGYTGTRGTHLDVLRAPNRDPDGLRIDGVQAFLWESSEGRSILHAVTMRLRKQQARGIAGAISYTVAKSMDDASSIGGDGRVVAQNDQNLAAEWGLSSFDRRHQLTGSVSIELPFGTGRRWLDRGGRWAALLGDWSMSMNVTGQSGTPYTARVIGAATDVARGTNGTLRADYTGAPIALEVPSLRLFFNTAAFAAPAPGMFGTAARNTIIGPASYQADASVVRDVRLNGRNTISIQVQATNLFNSVRFGSIDTVLNSPTFGQVMSMQPMRTVQLNLRYRF
jgi:hypothetical protein